MLEILCLAAVFHGKSLNFGTSSRNALSEERSIWFYHASDSIFLPISLLLIVKDLDPIWSIARWNAFFHYADYPNRSRKLICKALRDMSDLSISFFGLIIGTFLW